MKILYLLWKGIMSHKKLYVLILSLVFSSSIFAFDNGFTLGIKVYPTATLTMPHISKEDMAYLGGNGMKGMLGYITTGSAELTYLFDSVRYFGYQDASIFSGLGLAGYFGVGQGFSGQVSGQYNETVGDINVYCRVYMKVTLNMGAKLKTFLFNNRMSVNFGLGLNMLLDPHPTYELTTNLSTEQVEALKGKGLDFSNETGTLLITDEMMKKMNPVGYVFNFGLEYYQPVTSHMKLTLGGFLSYTIYKPGYVSLPQKLAEAAKKGAEAETPPRKIDLSKPIKSFYMNALNFGLSVGLAFDV